MGGLPKCVRAGASLLHLLTGSEDLTIAIELLVLCAVLLGLVCLGLGYWWASASDRRAAGGKSVKELAAEKEAYQEQVVEHFKTTAELLNEMTDKYRDVYRHMAEGAQNLTTAESAGPALAALQSGLLAAPKTAEDAETVIESEAETISSEQPDTGDTLGAIEPVALDTESDSEDTQDADEASTGEGAAPEDETGTEAVEETDAKPEFFSNAEPATEDTTPNEDPESSDAPDDGRGASSNSKS